MHAYCLPAMAVSERKKNKQIEQLYFNSLLQVWEDDKLRWNPEDYGGVDMIHVPAESLWLPDIVLFNK